jgi:diguanylate cyclase (GGDEF)-like protein
MADAAQFERDLTRLVAACEGGLDVPAVLDAAAAAVSGALEATSTSTYALGEGRPLLTLVHGSGAPSIDPPGFEPELSGGRALLPLVSAGRVLGCIVADGVGDPDGLGRARIAAGVAAQAMDASRLWDAGGTGTVDPLTRLPNQIGFQSVLGRELARAKRTGQSLAVSLVDVEGLGEQAARHGSAERDRVLRLVADALEHGVRSYDCVCRLDRDRFALVLPGMTAESAATLVGRLSGGLGRWSPGDEQVTVSGGVAAFPEHAATNDELVRLASAARVRAGQAGGARVIAWDEQAQPERALEDVAEAMRAAGAGQGHSAEARAASAYAGHIAGALGLPQERIDRVRLAAFLSEADPAGDGGDGPRTAGWVAANMLDEEAAAWLLARTAPVQEAPVEARAIAVAAAFVESGGHRSQAAAGLALAELWGRAGDELDAGCVRALERLLAEEMDPV